MIGSIRRIGQLVLEAGGSDLPIKPLPRVRKGATPAIELIVFDLDEDKVECNVVEASDKSLERYLWLGSIRGQKHQVFVTVNDLRYILGRDLKDNKKKVGEHKHIFRALKTLIDEVGDSVEGVKELRDLIDEILEKFFQEGKMEWMGKFTEGECNPKKLGGRGLEVALFTPVVRKDGREFSIAELEAYKDLIRLHLYGRGETVEGRCHICGEEKPVLVDPAFPEATLLKLYVTDKRNFFPRLSDSGDATASAFGICIDCKRQLLAGLNYLERKFTVKLGGFTVHIIPSASWLDLSTLDKLSSRAIKDYLERADTFESLQEFEKGFEGLRSLLGGKEYWLNISFGRVVGGSAFEVVGFIQDVPTTRLLRVAETMRELASDVANDCGLGNWVLMMLGLRELWSIFPIPRDDIKPFVRLVSALYKGESLNNHWVLERGIELFRIVNFGYTTYNIRPKMGVVGLVRSLIKFSLLIRLLELMGVLEVSDVRVPDVDLPSLPGYIERYMSIMEFGARRRALFLMGVLMARIGAAQISKGWSKPILEKLNYAGMSKERLLTLANQIFDALRVNRILTKENEIIYSHMKTLLDEVIDQLSDPIENLYYILSGYAFETAKKIEGGRAQGGEE